MRYAEKSWKFYCYIEENKDIPVKYNWVASYFLIKEMNYYNTCIGGSLKMFCLARIKKLKNNIILIFMNF